MRFLIDAPLSAVVAEQLNGGGHDAKHVRDYGLAAAADEEIFARSAAEDRVLVSADTDFGTILSLRQEVGFVNLMHVGRSGPGMAVVAQPAVAALHSLKERSRSNR